MIDKLTDSNFDIYAAQNYDNPNCVDILEFQDDLSRIKYIKRLFKRYRETNDLKERLILNHLVTFYNVFKVEAATIMLIHRLNMHLDVLKPFLVFLKYWPENQKINIDDYVIDCNAITLDSLVVKKLRNF